MRKIVIAIVFLIGIVSLNESCTYKKEVTEYPSVSNCDTASVKYSVQVVDVLTTNCYSCHAGTASGSSGRKFDTYNTLKTYAQTGKLMKTVNHESGVVAMPLGGSKLSDCDIAKLRIWVNAGYPNN